MHKNLDIYLLQLFFLTNISILMISIPHKNLVKLNLSSSPLLFYNVLDLQIQNSFKSVVNCIKLDAHVIFLSTTLFCSIRFYTNAEASKPMNLMIKLHEQEITKT